jgi:hypothetical protein
MNGGNLHDRAGASLGGVVAGELAERAFRQCGLAGRQQFAFQDALGVAGKGSPVTGPKTPPAARL